MYRQMIGARDLTLIDTFISDHYKQHSPLLKDGKAGLAAALEQLKQLPAQAGASPVICVIADGDYVALLLDINLMGKQLLVTDLFRLEDGLIVEHWDAAREKHDTAPEPWSRAKQHRVLKEGDWSCIQSEVYIHNRLHVMYDWLHTEGTMVIEQIKIVQEVPDRMPHNNGMI